MVYPFVFPAMPFAVEVAHAKGTHRADVVAGTYQLNRP